MKPDREVPAKLNPLEDKVYSMLIVFREESGQTLGNRAIARELGLSRSEVGKIRRSINNKLGMPSGS